MPRGSKQWNRIRRKDMQCNEERKWEESIYYCVLEKGHAGGHSYYGKNMPMNDKELRGKMEILKINDYVFNLKNMTFAQAKADSLAYIEDQKKIRDFELELTRKREVKTAESSGKTPPPVESTKEEKDKVDAEKFQVEIDKLESDFAKLKGPGSKARKDEIREKINALKS